MLSKSYKIRAWKTACGIRNLSAVGVNHAAMIALSRLNVVRCASLGGPTTEDAATILEVVATRYEEGNLKRYRDTSTSNTRISAAI